MKDKNKRYKKEKSRFSIGAKLIVIISAIVLLSLGAITALVSWLVRGDLQIAAEENNFETNRRSALEAETILAHVRSDSRMLLQTITAPWMEGGPVRVSTDFFFAENPQIAALYLFVPAGTNIFFANEFFFQRQEIDTGSAEFYFYSNGDSLVRASRGETVLLNAAPFFSRPLLALFFPWRDGQAGGVLFSTESLNESFGAIANRSYMINNEGDVLAHADFDLVNSGINVGDRRFVQNILESSDRSRQELIEAEHGFFKADINAVKDSFFVLMQESIKQKIMPVIDTYITKQNAPGENTEADGTVRQFTAFTKLNTAGAVVITSIDYDRVFEGIAATTRRNIYLTTVVLSISIILIWVFSKSITIPIKVLADAAHKIEGGNFELKLEPRGRDEVGLLTASFRRMCGALHVFGRFTNRDITVKAMRGEIKPGGLPKHATIFFSDIRDFTEKSENFTRTFGDGASGRIVHWLNEYFTHMVECVEKTGGVVDKFIGDAVMAHWGTAYTAGSPRKDAYNCIRAALMMRLELIKMNKKHVSGGDANPPIKIGCGINTGIVTAGQIGSDLRMEYTAIGDPVNLASRTEALTKPLGADILITEDTWRLIRDKFITEEMPPVTVKGKEKPVRIFAVVNIKGFNTGIKTLADVRKILGITPPDLSKVDVNADEKNTKSEKDERIKR